MVMREIFSSYYPVEDGGRSEECFGANVRPVIVYSNGYEYHNYNALEGKYLINNENTGYLYVTGQDEEKTVTVTYPAYSSIPGVTITIPFLF